MAKVISYPYGDMMPFFDSSQSSPTPGFPNGQSTWYVDCRCNQIGAKLQFTTASGGRNGARNADKWGPAIITNVTSKGTNLSIVYYHSIAVFGGGSSGHVVYIYGEYMGPDPTTPNDPTIKSWVIFNDANAGRSTATVWMTPTSDFPTLLGRNYYLKDILVRN